MLRYWLCFASAVCLARHCGANYCRDANLCCPGRDSACVVQKAHQNAIIEDLTDKPCYCDHACLKLGDCCPDFRETCGVWNNIKATFYPEKMHSSCRISRNSSLGGFCCQFAVSQGLRARKLRQRQRCIQQYDSIWRCARNGRQRHGAISKLFDCRCRHRSAIADFVPAALSITYLKVVQPLYKLKDMLKNHFSLQQYFNKHRMEEAGRV
ncbi:hypothetical protein ABMA28_008945 [Loxostege sticticalis]|uniref:SMB domain-containing protein n=1 Tax=Loxostege sticticalis TaxID=481309 RepID=A0ABD0SF92_LOXSC